MQQKYFFHYAAIATAIALVIACFIPWVHYNSIDVTFNGYNVKPFSTGTNYGRAGIIITIFAVVSLLLTLLPYTFTKRMNLFVAAILLSYTLRTYVIFTGSLFEGEVVKLAGIYLINFLALFLLICACFPKDKKPATA